ncbi:P-type conjugative transfer protein TrbL [Xanthomonas translucens]|uniref:P-type conjugative transfer protein TrbL n=1 Tax=Xanthomonas campestris pv. translucens TaxID=343 RepID=UPI0002A7BA4B|nr:P-type conjugative transfer protein TrbL [Xanthomonas translucens]ELQ15702.1 TrbL/VirB6 plasmid conjugal transfer protein [Xanthomonas translucens DAR61454]MBC3972839.1 P-type conjugative transfer protein TrbL [Xanthomonas translucens pv. undulosa]MCT8281839.1 P-type conjugative transfer protein TrbL [Xanthomonas translucens pv. undulosa]MCT8316407.1 P-type conjugative transfer protein TrbL [Xanthomonas translucens pv. undulosa]QSQ58121.1 P-type conjugative transfer protein TrbL [Xanthomona
MRRILFYGGLLVPLLFASNAANAAIEPAGLLDEVADRFLAVSSSWAGTMTDAASWLFWTLVVISMVWTFGMMALRKADLGEFFAEFARFTITTGFFWWLLRNGPKFAMDIINSMRTLAAQASGQAGELTPSRAVDIGWDIVVKAADNYSVLSPIDNLSIFLITAAILACMAVVGANVLITLVNAWILAYAGIFVLGFGGARWTSDIAINYFRSVLGIGLKLLTITLLVGIAVSIMDTYYANLSQGAPLRELLLVFVVALVLTLLIHSVPNVIAGIVPGAAAATSIGSFSTGAIVGAGMATGGMAAQAVAAAASGGASLAASAAGGAQAVMAAATAAATAADGGVMPGASSGDEAGGGGSGDVSGSDETPMAAAAGDRSTGARGSAGGGGFSGAAGMAGRVATGAVANLAKGIGSMASAKAGSMADAAKDRIAETTGGKLAATIKAASSSTDGNTLSGSNDDATATA